MNTSLLKYLLFILLLISLESYGQLSDETASASNRFVPELSFISGRIIEHNSKFGPDIDGLSYMADFSVGIKSIGKKVWKHDYNHPDLMLGVLIGSYSNREIFGDSFSLYGGVDQQKQKGKWIRHFRYRGGIGYLNKPFDIITNTQNNVIGSKLNLMAKIDYGYEYLIQPKFGIAAMLSIMHHSNGKSASPNLGINLLAAQISFRYYNQAYNKSKYDLKENYELSKKHRFNILLNFARHELNEVNGPKYPVYGIDLYGSSRINIKSKYKYGIEYSYYTSAFRFLNHNLSSLENHHWLSSRFNIFAGYEILFGRMGLCAELGYYLNKPFLVNERITTKLGIIYYLKPTHLYDKNEWYITGKLKSHYFVADYLSLGIGHSF